MSRVIFHCLNRFRRTRLGRRCQPLLFFLGNQYRRLVAVCLPKLMVQKRIGRYGPFAISAKFLFSDFESWGQSHNSGFDQLIAASIGAHCVFDVGAHIGLTTLPLATTMTAGGVVVAFEPGNVNASFLEKHIAENKLENVIVIKNLVGDMISDQKAFYESEDVSGMNSLAEIRDKHPSSFVSMVTLDQVVSERNVIPDVIKIDVEGAELKVLRGARETLLRHSPIIFLSVHPRQLEVLGDSVEDLLDFVLGLGYEVFSTDLSLPVGSKLQFGEYKLVKRGNC